MCMFSKICVHYNIIIRCFESNDEMLRFREQRQHDFLSIESILNTLQDDMQNRGFLSVKSRSTISKLDLALLIIQTYVTYPYPSITEAAFPFNYCALPFLYPILAPVMNCICPN